MKRIGAGISVALTVAVVLLIAIGNGSPSPASAPAAERAGKFCQRDWAKANVTRFLQSVNLGARSFLEETIVEPPEFRVFSQGLDYRRKPKRFFSTKNREELIRHLLKRHDKGDRMPEVVKVTVSGHDDAFDICGFGFEVRRRIAGGPSRIFVGKGALDDATGDVAVWNTGAPKGKLDLNPRG